MARMGSPPRYKSKQEMQKKIDEYFEACKGRVLTGDDGEPICNKFGQPVMVDQKPPTITGLALALGFTSRQALLNYQAKPEFVDTITRAGERAYLFTHERTPGAEEVVIIKTSLYFEKKNEYVRHLLLLSAVHP